MAIDLEPWAAANSSALAATANNAAAITTAAFASEVRDSSFLVVGLN